MASHKPMPRSPCMPAHKSTATSRAALPLARRSTPPPPTTRDQPGRTAISPNEVRCSDSSCGQYVAKTRFHGDGKLALAQFFRSFGLSTFWYFPRRMEYEAVIGLETHVQLKTRSK